MEEEIKPIEENIEKVEKKTKTKKQYKTEKCKIIESYRDEIVVNFKGYCLRFVTDKSYSNTVDIEYYGKIGNKNFEIKLK